MSWKNWGYAKRGGIIALVIDLIILFVTDIILLTAHGEAGLLPFLIMGYSQFFIPFIIIPLFQIIGDTRSVFVMWIILINIISLVSWFFLGTFFGWLTGILIKRRFFLWFKVDKKYLLTGGIILGLLFLIPNLIISLFPEGSEFLWGQNDFTKIIFPLIVYTILFFIIGGIIGFIVGKIKNK